MHRVWGDRPVAYRSWAVDPEPTPLERAFWRRFDVDVLDVDPDEYVGLLARRLEALGVSVASPYRGLAAFEDSELDALYFFGRERDTEIVVANLIASRFTVLYGPSGVGKSSLLLAAVARTLRELPEQPLVVVFSSWGDDPRAALAAAVAEAARSRGRRAGRDVSSARRPRRDVYLILDQAEEYFTYHDGDGRLRGRTRRARQPPAAGQRAPLASRGHARAARSPQGDDPEPLRQRAPPRPARPRGRARGDRPPARALERARRATRSSPRTRSSSASSTASAPGRIELGTGRGRASSSRTGRRAGSRRRTSSSSCSASGTSSAARARPTLRVETLDALGGAGQIVADHLERAIDALTPDAARDRGAPLRPPRHAVRDEDRARGLRPRRVRRRVGGGGPARRGDAREPPHPADGRERSVGDLPRRPRRRRARLEEPSRRGTGGCACSRRGATAASPARSARLRGAGRPRARVRARRLRVLAAERRARAGAGREGRAAGRERAVAARERPGARAGVRARGRGGRPDVPGGGCSAPVARRVA